MAETLGGHKQKLVHTRTQGKEQFIGTTLYNSLKSVLLLSPLDGGGAWGMERRLRLQATLLKSGQCGVLPKFTGLQGLPGTSLNFILQLRGLKLVIISW